MSALIFLLKSQGQYNLVFHILYFSSHHRNQVWLLIQNLPVLFPFFHLKIYSLASNPYVWLFVNGGILIRPLFKLHNTRLRVQWDVFCVLEAHLVYYLGIVREECIHYRGLRIHDRRWQRVGDWGFCGFWFRILIFNGLCFFVMFALELFWLLIFILSLNL